MNDNIKKLNKETLKKISIITLIVAIVLIVGGTLATFNFDTLFEGLTTNKLSTCKLSLNVKDDNPITLVEAYPISDEKAKKYTPYTFTITNKSDCDTAYYKITLGDICNTCSETNDICTVNGQALNCSDAYKIPSIKIKYELVNKNTNETILKGNPEKMKITGSLAKNESINFELKLWIDSSATNEDLYVYENGKPKENADGSIVTRNAGYKINVESQDTEFIDPPTGADTLIAKVGTDGLVAESHPATEQLQATTDYRYTGANPNNYIKFNNEVWRIIGVFDTDDGAGNLEKRIKIIRDSIGKRTWDSNRANNWSKASGMKLLNTGDYWNRTGDYASNGLTPEAKGQIADAKWYLGGTKDYTSVSNGLASHFYSYERGTTVYGSNPTSWAGKVGLMYPSDYGYATSGGSTTNRDTCLAKEMYNWREAQRTSDCYNNNWLYDSSNHQWTLAPNSGANGVFNVISAGYVDNASVRSAGAFRPCVNLSSDIEITGGSGTSESPINCKIESHKYFKVKKS